MIAVREYREEDRAQVVECFIELQEFEREAEPRRKAGLEIAENYVDDLLKLCNEDRGRIFVAVNTETVIGFACILPQQALDAELNEPYRTAYLTDLIVTKSARGKRVGELLIQAAESYSRERGALSMVLNVLAANETARRFYAAQGFDEYELKLEKRF